MPKKSLKLKTTSEKKTKIQKYSKYKGKIKKNQKNSLVGKTQNIRNLHQMNNNITTKAFRQIVKANSDKKQMWEYEEEIQLSRLNALRNKLQNSNIPEDQDDPKKQMIQQSKFQQDQYYQSGIINYCKNDQNQQRNDYNNNMNNFRDVQNQNTQTFQRKDEVNTNTQQNQYYNERRNYQQNNTNEQTRRNYRDRRYSTSNSRYSETNSYRTRNSESNYRSNSRYRRNNNYYNSIRNTKNRNNYYNQNRNNRYQHNNLQNRNYQQIEYQQAITSTIIKSIQEIQETTCRYWKNRTCRNYEYGRKHFQMVQLMNLYHKPKYKRIKNNIYIRLKYYGK